MTTQKKYEEYVLGLLKRINRAKDLVIGSIDEREKKDPLLFSFKNIDAQLKIVKNHCSDAKTWEDKIGAKIIKLEHQIHYVLINAKYKSGHGQSFSVDELNNLSKELKLIAEDVEVLKEALHQLAVEKRSQSRSFSDLDPGYAYGYGDREAIFKASSVAGRKVSEKWLQLCREDNSLTSHVVESLQQLYYNNLDTTNLKLCALCFSIFPENFAIKKRLLIYWWMSEGFVEIEDEGEDYFKKLLEFGIITPSPPTTKKPSTLVNECTVHPWIRSMLISLAKPAGLFDFDSRGIPIHLVKQSKRACLVYGNKNFSEHIGAEFPDKLSSVFNVSEKFINFNPDMLRRLKKFKILQLGGWHGLSKNRSEAEEHHIEVVDEGFLVGLVGQNHLKYLSLRGISSITTLPSFISDLFNLEILDLKACHNLETLRFDISKLKKLMHFDVSDCPLLDSMPKGLDKLTNLQVLKGFMIGNVEKTPCKLSDVANMKELRRLSVYVGAEAVVQKGEFGSLGRMEKLQCLTILWGVKDAKQVANMTDLSFPKNLEKLDLRGIPCLEEEDPTGASKSRPLVELDSSKLRKLNRLYIRGGELTSLNCKNNIFWAVTCLQLNYLKHFNIDKEKLLADFPRLIYLEVKYDRFNGFVLAEKELGKLKEKYKKKGQARDDGKQEDKYLLKRKGKSKVEDSNKDNSLPKSEIEEVVD